MLRRLFDDFQQRVKRRDGQHVYLVDDVHALFDLAGRIDCVVAQNAHRVHTVIRRSVNFQHVHAAAVINGAARRTAVAGVAVLRVEAVDCLRQNFCAGGLAGAARAGKQIRMAELSRLQLRAQRVGHALLPHHVRKCLGSVFPIQSLIHASHPLRHTKLLYTIPRENGSLKSLAEFCARRRKIKSKPMEALIKSVAVDGERFFVKTRFEKRRNTVCISRFSNRRIVGKDPSSAVGDLFRGSLCYPAAPPTGQDSR